MEQLIVYKFRRKFLSTTIQKYRIESWAHSYWGVTVEYQCPSTKLVHVGGLRSHLNTEITSHVCKQGPGRQELWTNREHCMSHSFVKLPVKLYIIYLLQHWIHAND